MTDSPVRRLSCGFIEVHTALISRHNLHLQTSNCRVLSVSFFFSFLLHVPSAFLTSQRFTNRSIKPFLFLSFFKQISISISLPSIGTTQFCVFRFVSSSFVAFVSLSGPPVVGISMSSSFEMAIDSCAALSSVDDDYLESRSISELVSFLRTAFRAKDFDRVEEVLVAKEVKMRKEIESKNKDYELLQSKYEFLRLDNLTRESKVEQDKVEVDPKGFEKWKEAYEQLKERESEIQQLKELIVKVNEDREKKKSALEGFEKMLEVVKGTQENDRLTIEKLTHKNLELQSTIEVVKKEKEDYEKTIEELKCKNLKLECAMEELKKTEEEEDDRKNIEDLKCKNSTLECAKREVEHNYELPRRKYDELVRQVSQLEKTVVENGEPIAPNRNDSWLGGSRKLIGKRGVENDKFENRTGKQQVSHLHIE